MDRPHAHRVAVGRELQPGEQFALDRVGSTGSSDPPGRVPAPERFEIRLASQQLARRGADQCCRHAGLEARTDDRSRYVCMAGAENRIRIRARKAKRPFRTCVATFRRV